MNKSLKVLHTPFVIAGNASGLAEGERAIGLLSKLYYFERNKYSQVNQDDIFISCSKNLFLEYIQKFIFVIKVLFKFDVIHYNYGSTIFRPKKILFPHDHFVKKIAKTIFNASFGLIYNLDLKIFYLFRKKIFMTFQGSDSRITGFHVRHFEFSHCKVLEYGVKDELIDLQKQHNINTYFKYVNHFFALNPDLLHTLPNNSSFLPYSNINLREWSFFRPRSESNFLRILHAPSNLDVKGTKYILQAIEKLRIDGFNFEFRLIHDVNHEQMKNIMLNSDILIDQLLAGWYGGVAVEAMALGMPVICYIRDEDKKYLPAELIVDLPIIEATPKTIYEVIKRVLDMPREELKNKQQSCREFVEKWHDPKKVAAITNQYYLER